METVKLTARRGADAGRPSWGQQHKSDVQSYCQNLIDVAGLSKTNQGIALNQLASIR
jgi:hypothetical protein